MRKSCLVHIANAADADRRRRWPVAFTLGVASMVVLLADFHPAQANDDNAGHVIRLFNGRNFDGWYVYTTETQYENPDVFQVVGGMIYVPGGRGDVGHFGGLITEQPYENYRLRLDYKWGEATYGRRKNMARDAGVLLHCVGPNGPGPWMTSYEYQIIEGGTGDLLLVNTGRGDEARNPVTLTCTAEHEKRDGGQFFKKDGELHTFKDKDRLNWSGRDPDWKDEVGFRGRHDLESSHGEWTRCEILARGDTLEFYVNGKLANRTTDLSGTRGKILLQTEGAEVWYRNIELTPLKESERSKVQ